MTKDKLPDTIFIGPSDARTKVVNRFMFKETLSVRVHDLLEAKGYLEPLKEKAEGIAVIARQVIDEINRGENKDFDLLDKPLDQADRASVIGEMLNTIINDINAKLEKDVEAREIKEGKK